MFTPVHVVNYPTYLLYFICTLITVVQRDLNEPCYPFALYSKGTRFEYAEVCLNAAEKHGGKF